MTSLAIAGAPRAAHAEGHDFIREARVFHRVVACGTDTAVPKGFDARQIEAHCKPLRRQIISFRKRYVERARRFFDNWRPPGLPKRVVYPFGGGDLVSALTTYPDATEITTISLEHPGDPRRLEMIDAETLEERLTVYNLLAGQLMKWHDSASKNLRKLETGPLPGQLGLFMLALAVHDLEPVSLRYFRIEPDGSLHYYTLAEIEALDDVKAKKLDPRWVNTDFSVAFKNMELSFRPRGAGPEDPVITHRHIAWNLDDDHFGKSALRKHLEAKGKVATMTKAASFLLWMNSFSNIRNYLLTNSVFMVSDATGPLPHHAKQAGHEQITFGVFEGPFLEYAEGKNAERMVELWATNKKRGLPFRYGYPDNNNHVHLMITRPRKK